MRKTSSSELRIARKNDALENGRTASLAEVVKRPGREGDNEPGNAKEHDAGKKANELFDTCLLENICVGRCSLFYR